MDPLAGKEIVSAAGKETVSAAEKEAVSAKKLTTPEEYNKLIEKILKLTPFEKKDELLKKILEEESLTKLSEKDQTDLYTKLSKKHQYDLYAQLLKKYQQNLNEMSYETVAKTVTEANKRLTKLTNYATQYEEIYEEIYENGQKRSAQASTIEMKILSTLEGRVTAYRNNIKELKKQEQALTTKKYIKQNIIHLIRYTPKLSTINSAELKKITTFFNNNPRAIASTIHNNSKKDYDTILEAVKETLTDTLSFKKTIQNPESNQITADIKLTNNPIDALLNPEIDYGKNPNQEKTYNMGPETLAVHDYFETTFNSIHYIKLVSPKYIDTLNTIAGALVIEDENNLIFYSIYDNIKKTKLDVENSQCIIKKSHIKFSRMYGLLFGDVQFLKYFDFKNINPEPYLLFKFPSPIEEQLFYRTENQYTGNITFPSAIERQLFYRPQYQYKGNNVNVAILDIFLYCIKAPSLLEKKISETKCILTFGMLFGIKTKKCIDKLLPDLVLPDLVLVDKLKNMFTTYFEKLIICDYDTFIHHFNNTNTFQRFYCYILLLKFFNYIASENKELDKALNRLIEKNSTKLINNYVIKKVSDELSKETPLQTRIEDFDTYTDSIIKIFPPHEKPYITLQKGQVVSDNVEKEEIELTDVRKKGGKSSKSRKSRKSSKSRKSRKS